MACKSLSITDTLGLATLEKEKGCSFVRMAGQDGHFPWRERKNVKCVVSDSSSKAAFCSTVVRQVLVPDQDWNSLKTILTRPLKSYYPNCTNVGTIEKENNPEWGNPQPGLDPRPDSSDPCFSSIAQLCVYAVNRPGTWIHIGFEAAWWTWIPTKPWRNRFSERASGYIKVVVWEDSDEVWRPPGPGTVSTVAPGLSLVT